MINSDFACDRCRLVRTTHHLHVLLLALVVLQWPEPSVSFVAPDGTSSPFVHFTNTKHTVPTTCRSTSLLPAFSITRKDDVTPSMDVHVHLDSQLSQTADDSTHWTTLAANTLSLHGVCILSRSPNSVCGQTSKALIRTATCDATNAAIMHHLSRLHSKITSRGIDPSGLQDGAYRFREVVCRDGSPRFDVPVPWSGSQRLNESDTEADGHHRNEAFTRSRLSDFVDSTDGCKAIQNFHTELDEFVQPVISSLWSSENDVNRVGKNNNDTGGRATSAGFLVNRPGSTSQPWHRDGPEEGYINAFVPFVHLEESLGPTSILPGTHAMPNLCPNNDMGGEVAPSPIVPLLEKGQILLFDYRTFHRGLGNTNSEGLSRTLAYAVYTRGSIKDTHNFPDALTLEFD